MMVQPAGQILGSVPQTILDGTGDRGGLVYRWPQQLEQQGNGVRTLPGIAKARDQELNQLRRELRSVRAE